MDIAKMATALSQAQVKQQVSLSVMKLILDNERMQGSEMTELLDGNLSARPVHPHLGGTIDIRA